MTISRRSVNESESHLAMRLNSRIARWVLYMLSWLAGFYAAVSGVSIALVNPGRFAAPQYATANQLPGFPLWWGAALMACGLLILAGMLLGRFRAVEYGVYLAATWEFFYAGTFIRTAASTEHAAWTPAVAHVFIALVYILVGAAFRQSKDV